MNDRTEQATELPAGTGRTPDEAGGDFATGERTEPRDAGTELHEGDFAAGERTTTEVPAADHESDLHGDFAAGERTEPIEADHESDLHGDFAAGERTEPIEADDEVEGSFADTNS